MTYNISRSAVARWAGTLALLDGSVVELKPAEGQSAHMLGYSLREALASAKELNIEPYNRIEYSISPKPKLGVVICKPRANAPVLVSHTQLAPEFPEAENEFDVVMCMTGQDLSIARFPKFSGDVESVRFWADGRGYVIKSEKPLVLEKAQ